MENDLVPAMNDIMREAEYRMWLVELDAMKRENGITKADWPKRRIAAAKICEIVGIQDLIRAISMDGELRPPPLWPEVDCVPVGGGPGLITCEVRTRHRDRGVVKVSIGLKQQGKKFHKEQIGEAIERGKFELKKKIESP